MRFTRTPGEEEIREHDDAAKAEPRRALERRLDARMGDAAEGDLGPAEAHALPQHARDLGDVGVGVGVVGAAADHDEQRLVARRRLGPRRPPRRCARRRRRAASGRSRDRGRGAPRCPGLAAAKLLISHGRSFLTWLAANSMPGTARMRRAPRAPARRARRGSSAGRIRDSRSRHRSPASARAAPPRAARTRGSPRRRGCHGRTAAPRSRSSSAPRRSLCQVPAVDAPRARADAGGPCSRCSAPIPRARSAAAAAVGAGARRRCSATRRRCSAAVPHPVVLRRPRDRLARPQAQPAGPPRRASPARRRSRPCWRSWSAPRGGLGSVDRAARRAAAGRRLVEVAVIARAAGAAQPLRACRARSAPALDHEGLAGGRDAVRHIVGRDPRASTSTASRAPRSKSWPRISATAWWRRCSGILLLGLPGLFAYKMANTLDSMIGHRSPRYRAFGWAAARLDDLAQPGAGAAPRLADRASPRALAAGQPAAPTRCAIMLRDARKHRSPNAGWPEAAMAGALGLALAGRAAMPARWSTTLARRRHARAPTAGDIRRALRPVRRRLPGRRRR